MRRFATVCVLALAGCGASVSPTAEPPARCSYGPGGLPDESCSPGVRDPRVTQQNLHETVCVRGYSKRVRPPLSYTAPLKRRLQTAYGTKVGGDDELDHRISISLGGAPRDPRNLWPEHNDHPPGALNSKDLLEFRLYDELCSGKVTLVEAQRQVLAWRP